MSQTSKKTIALTTVALVLASGLLYAPTLAYDFLNFDDPEYVLRLTPMFGGDFITALDAIFFRYFPRVEPLIVRDISYAVNAHLFGAENPLGYHLGNVVVHALNTGLLYLLLLKLGCGHRFALAVTVLHFSLPVHVEPVAWITSRKDLLSAFFMLLGMIGFLSTRDQPAGLRRIFTYVATLFCVGLACLSKISAFVLPGLMWILAIRPTLKETSNLLKSLPSMLREALMLIPHLVVAVALVFWYMGVIKGTTVDWPTLERGDHLFHVITLNPLVVARFVGMIFLPLQLSVYETWPSAVFPYPPWQVGIAVLLICCYIAGALLLWRKSRESLVFLLMTAVILFPYSNVFYNGLWVASRYLYLAGFPVIAVFVMACMQLNKRMNSQLPGNLLMAVLLLMSLMRTWQFMPAFRNSESLWRYEMTHDQPTLRAYIGLAGLCQIEARKTEDPSRKAALQEEALRLTREGFARYSPERVSYRVPYTKAYMLLIVEGLVNQDKGNLREAIALYERSLAHYYDDTTLSMLSYCYKQLAEAASDEDEKRQWIKASFKYFMRYYQAYAEIPYKVRQLEPVRRDFLRQYPYLQKDR